MAAPAMGHRETDHIRVVALVETALDIAEEVLAPGGAFLAKVFQGGAGQDLVTRLKQVFAKVHHVKPKASRADCPKSMCSPRGFRGLPSNVAAATRCSRSCAPRCAAEPTGLLLSLRAIRLAWPSRSNAMHLEVVKDYYGKVLKSSKDLKTSACCDGGGVPAASEPLLENVHPEVAAKYYGCGIVVPAALEGRRVLDLGSGSGRDVYLMAQLVGRAGEVVGVDMTDEQLATANAHIDWHRRQFGYERRNVKFLKGYIEKLDELGLEPAELRRDGLELRDQSLASTSSRCCAAPSIC